MLGTHGEVRFGEQNANDFSSTTTPRCFLFSLAALRSSFLCGAIGLFLAPQRNEERRETVNQIKLRAAAFGHSLHVRDMNLAADLTTRDCGRVLVLKHSIATIIQDQT